MTLLVTGATGFVMAVLGRHWLEADPEARLVVLDSSPLDAAAQRYFAPVMKRLSVVIADVTQAETWQPALARHGITHLVHGATITPLARGTVAEIGPGARGVAPGDFVSGESHVNCGRCGACRRGEPHICERLQIIGVDRDGAFTDFVVLPAQNARKMPPATPVEVAAARAPFSSRHTAPTVARSVTLWPRPGAPAAGDAELVGVPGGVLYI